MTDASSQPSPIDELAESFARRLRRGERPQVDEYVRKYPELADAIRDVFPAVEMVEGLAPELDESTRSPSKQIEPLDRLGDYRIIREIGRGGMGVVYEAEQESLRRRVAVKVFPATAASSTTHLQRFYREAQSAASLHHTNIVPVFEVGNRAGVHFYAMQFIHGQDLDEVFQELKRLRQVAPTVAAAANNASELALSIASSLVSGVGPQRSITPTAEIASAGGEQTQTTSSTQPAGSNTSVELLSTSTSSISARDRYYVNLARLGLQVAEALAYAHGQGILHRDIKPANLLLDMAGVVWVTDFGLAKLHEQPLTETGDVVGTIRYMAPERFHGQADARSDIYSLGLTLYELATLREPFSTTGRAELIRHIATVEPTAPRRVDPRIPRDLETIILKTIEKEPSRRYRSATQLADDLRLFLADKPVNARRINWPERCWRWCRRNKIVAALGAVVIGLVLMFSVVSFVAALRMRALASSLQAEHRLSTRRLFDSCIDQAQSRRFSQRPGQRIKSLRALGEAASLFHEIEWTPAERETALVNLRSDIISSLSLFDLTQRSTWDLPTGFEHPQFDTEYARYAISSWEGTIQIRTCDDNRLLHEFAGEGLRSWGMRFSPSGTFIASNFHHGNEPGRFMRVWDTKTGELVLHEEGSWAGFYDFSKDDRLFASCSLDGNIRLVTLARPRDPPIILKSSIQPDYIRFRPERSELIAASTRSQQVELWDLESRTNQVIETDFAVHSIDWDRNSTRVAMGCSDHLARIWPADNLTSEPVELTGHRGPVVQVSFNPEGTLLFSRSWDGSNRMWDVPGATELFHINARCIHNCPFAGTNQIALYDRERFGVWEFGVDSAVSIVSSDKAIRSLVYHPHLPVLCLATREGVSFAHAGNGTIQRHLPIGFVFNIVFNRDGDRLYTSGSAGVLEWPVTVKEKGQVTVGPPKSILGADGLAEQIDEDLRSTPVIERIALDASGRWLSVDCGAQVAVVVDLQDDIDDQRPLQLICFKGRPEHQNRLNYATITPDANWVVTTTWLGDGIWVWNAKTGALAHKLSEAHESGVPAISPDGQWLAVTTKDSLRFWKVGSWQLVHEFAREVNDWSGGITFSPDSQLCVSAYSRRALQVRKMPTGQRIAVIHRGNRQAIGHPIFSPDGTSLTARSEAAIVRWDLRRVESRLSSVGLDGGWKQEHSQARYFRDLELEFVTDLGELGPQP